MVICNPVLRRLRQEDCELKASLGSIANLILNASCVGARDEPVVKSTCFSKGPRSDSEHPFDTHHSLSFQLQGFPHPPRSWATIPPPVPSVSWVLQIPNGWQPASAAKTFQS